MLTKLFFMTSASFLILAMAQATVHAAPMAKSLQGSEFLFSSLAETFPEFVKEYNGTQEITLQSLDCYSANEIVEGRHILKTRCHAIDNDFKNSEDDAGPLFLTMINLRLKVHNYSSPGITYVNVRELKCTRNAKETACTVREAWN